MGIGVVASGACAILVGRVGVKRLLLLSASLMAASMFFVSLLRSEARHYQDYLSLAEQIAGKEITERVVFFGKVEAELITTPDKEFKFHSGIPNRL